MSDTRQLPLSSIRPNPDQPRKVFERGALESLAASLAAPAGQLQAIRVAPQADGTFMIVLGERRWRAAQLLGWETIRAEVVPMTADEVADAAIVENLQRQDISPLEEARAFQRRLDAGLSVEELAGRLGMKQAWRITERTALLRLDAPMQEALARGILTPTQAFEMSKLTATNQRVLFDAIGEGRCRSAAELRRTVAVLLDSERQQDMFAAAPAEPTAGERRQAKAMEGIIDKLCALVSKGFDGNECVALRKCNPVNADVMAERLALVEDAVRRMRLELAATAALRAAK